MGARRVQRVGAEEGYDRWSETYDETPNPVVVMDSRHTLSHLDPKPNERILDAGCGTGRNLDFLLRAGSTPVGLDFSTGMLNVARRNHPSVPLVRVDLSRALPLRERQFDAVLCALVGEHLENLRPVLAEFHAALRPSGRLIFSVYHPEMAAAGIEANFERSGVEYRLGAIRHTVEDYVDIIEAVGFTKVHYQEFSGDELLAEQVPGAAKYLGFPILLVMRAKRGS